MKKLLLLIALLPSLPIIALTDNSKIYNLEPLNTLKDIIKPDNDLSISSLRGLINALNAYARNAPAGIRLAPPLSDIYNAVNDIYKELYDTDEELSKKAVSITKGGITTGVVRTSVEHRAADRFLAALVYSIVTGKFDEYLLPVTASLTAASYDLAQQIKDERIGY